MVKHHEVKPSDGVGDDGVAWGHSRDQAVLVGRLHLEENTQLGKLPVACVWILAACVRDFGQPVRRVAPGSLPKPIPTTL